MHPCIDIYIPAFLGPTSGELRATLHQPRCPVNPLTLPGLVNPLRGLYRRPLWSYDRPVTTPSTSVG